MPLNEQEFVAWQQATLAAMPSADEEEPLKGASKSPVPIRLSTQVAPEFHKTSVRSPLDRKESLLTRALQPTSEDDPTSNLQHAIEMARHRSTRSNTSTSSTAELTSDGDLTSPARSNTPSPPIPNNTYLSFAPYTLGPKLTQLAKPQIINQLALVGPKETGISQPDPKVEALVKKRCISFACGAQKPKSPESALAAPKAQPTETPKRTIKFACTIPKPSQNVSPAKVEASLAVKPLSPQKSLDLRRQASRSPSLTRKIRPTLTSSPSTVKGHRDSVSTIRRASQSPAAVRGRKPKYIVADEEALESSEATRFHEFASDGPQEDDWIRKDLSHMKEKLTINDTLKKENAIRQLGKEAEEEALQDEEEEEDDDEEIADDTDDENDDENDESDYQDNDHTINGSEDEASDGNETDNEAGFADSDDETDPAGEYQFWTPGKGLFATGSGEASGFLTSANRAASVSSIDSLSHMSPILKANGIASGRSKPSRKIKIRPGTPDLPDSTDFVCGTLDEDRPLEEAYVSCMEARKREKHHLIPQDIDPSFPTSDPEEEEDENDDIEAEESNDELWLHGKFEDSEDEGRSRRRTGRRSQEQSPRRLHSPPPKHYSPPPARVRHRSPPPRRLFNHSPKRMRSPPPARIVRSPRTSPMDNHPGITFKPLGDRPGLTHTKSLPRRTSAFCQQYRAARLISANAEDDTDTPDGHTRGAIDIVKGLEHKRQRRKEKFYRQQCNRARKGQNERRPQPGKGAERMRELGLQMAGKADLRNNNKAEYVLSV